MTFPLKNKLILILLLFINLLAIPNLQVMAESSGIFCGLAIASGGACLTPSKSDINSCLFYSTLKGAVDVTITNITPLKVPQGTTLDLLISALNTNFNLSSIVQIDGITVNHTNTVSPTKIQANVTVPLDAMLDSHVIRVTTQGQTVENNCLLQVTEMLAVPEILSISPAIVEPNSTGSATIYGANTHFSAESQINLGGGITSTVTRVISPTQLEVSLVVPADTNTLHDAKVTTGNEIASGQHLLFVTNFSKLPIITQVEPNHAQAGTTITMNIVGRDTDFLAEVSSVSLGSGITVKSLQVQNETLLTVTVDIAKDANSGNRDILVSTPLEMAMGIGLFNVEPSDPEPPVPNVNHAPTEITLSNLSVPADSAEGTEIGQFSTTDPDEQDSHQYTLVKNAEIEDPHLGKSGGLFSIKEHSLQVAKHDFLKAGSYEIIVRASDKAGLSVNETFIVVVTAATKVENGPEPPAQPPAGQETPLIPPPPAEEEPPTPVDSSGSKPPPVAGEGEVTVVTEETKVPAEPTSSDPEVTSGETTVKTPPVADVKDVMATPSTTDSGLTVITVDECQPQSNLMLYPAQKTLTLTVGDEPFDLEFSGGQGTIIIDDTFDNNIVIVESFDFPKLRLLPLKAGETIMTLKDCAGHEAVVNIIVEASEPLQPQQQTLTLFMAEPPMTLLFTGKCQASLRQPPNSEIITVQEQHFPEAGGAQITLLAREVGGPTELIIDDDCGHTATVKLSVASVDPCAGRTSTTMELFLVENGEPMTQWIVGESNYRDLTQPPEGTFVDLQFMDSHETGGAKLLFTPRKAGQTTMKLNTSKCYETEIKITVLRARTLTHLCWLDERTEDICQNADDEQVLAPNALGINRQGESVETTAYFSSQQLDADGHLNLRVVVDETQVHQQANLLMVAISEVANIKRFFMYDGQAWQKWDGELAHLVKFKDLLRLPHLLAIEEVISLEELQGLSTIYVGYQLENGTIIFNGQNPLLFKGSNASQLINNETIIPSSARFEGSLSAFSQDLKPENGLMVIPTKDVTLSMKIAVEKAHIGQAVSLVLVVSQQLGDKKRFFTLESDQCRNGVGNSSFNQESQRWSSWDGNFADLKVAHRWDRLPETTQLQCPLSLDKLPLETPTGKFTVYTVYVGYRLGNGVTVFNGLEPLEFRFK